MPGNGSRPAAQPCQSCGTTVRTYTCIQCNNLAFCDECWPKWVLHVPGSVGWNGKPHERADPIVLHRLRQILEPQRSETDHEAELRDDEDTSWFGFGRDPSGQSIFHDYGRFAAIMADTVTEDTPERHPQLASFVGETGAGKSTVIKLLIDRQDMTSLEESRYYSPVTSSNHDRIPTTGDVHLYGDPATMYTSTPLLLCDCEGLSGGETLPKQLRSRSDALANGYKPSTQRRIVWAKTPNTKKREYAVSQLYPRILYTFSDVVVFVLRNPRAFESAVLPKLLRWGAASIDKSLNQPVLPHAIIVLNATDPNIDEKEWDVQHATEMMMSDVHGAIAREPALQEYVQQWRQRGKNVSSTKELLECYYASISVVRIPYKGSYMLMNEQAGKLSELIRDRAQLSHLRKRRVRMLATPEKLQFYLHAAFDHFTQDLDSPFDFIKETLRHTPVSRNFEGNILSLALAIRDRASNEKIKSNARQIFRAMVPIIASCVMFDNVRQNLLGTASRLLDDRYAKPCAAALQTFADLHWPCSYTNPAYPGDLGRCCNVRAGHNPKGHQNIQGKIIGNGDYESDLDPVEFASVWHQLIRTSLLQLQASALRLGQDFSNMSELQISALLHRERLNEQYTNILGSATDFISYSACLCCLRELPECALPCGHVLCLLCIQTYGTKSSRTTIEISRCPLHVRDVIASPPWVINIKPAQAGVRTLCLDGGGVRGIVQLQVLREIETMLGPDLPIQLFFDLMVGTNTGGLIAIGLGVKKWSVQATIEKFKDLCREAFTPREMKSVPIFGTISTLFHGSIYKTQPLEKALKRYFSDQPFFGASVHRSRANVQLKVGVTATSSMGHKSALFANYNRPDPTGERLPYEFVRSDMPSKEIRMWEAARVTTATQPFFKSFVKKETSNEYVDGSAKNVCPIRVCHHEAQAIWHDDAHQDLVFSIGTGRNVGDSKTATIAKSSQSMTTTSASTNAPHGSAVVRQGRGGAGNYIVKDKQAVQGSAMQARTGASGYFVRDPRTPMLLSFNNPTAGAERSNSDHRKGDAMWNRFLENEVSAAADKEGSDVDRAARYIRINPELFSELPKFADVTSIDQLQRETEEALRRNPGIVVEAAHRLIASTFFFEREPGSVKQTSSAYTCTGSIYCRFRQGSQELKALGWVLVSISCLEGDFEPYFLLEEDDPQSARRRIVLTQSMLQDMHFHGQFELDQVELRALDETSEIRISLCLQAAAYPSGTSVLPISGFPRRVMTPDPKTPGQVVGGNGSSLGGRTASGGDAVGEVVGGTAGAAAAAAAQLGMPSLSPTSLFASSPYLERQHTGSNHSYYSRAAVSTPESVVASTVASSPPSATIAGTPSPLGSPPLGFVFPLRCLDGDLPELPGSAPAVELEGQPSSPPFSETEESFVVKKEVRLRM